MKHNHSHDETAVRQKSLPENDAEWSDTNIGNSARLRCAEPAPLGKTEEDLGDTLRALARRKPEGRPTAGHTEPSKQPLVLCGHGVLLRVEGGAFTIRNGFTHYPQKQETYRFFKGELSIHRALETAAFLSTCSHGSANKTCLSFALIGKAMCRAFWPTTAT
jgi:hypothetical protein